MEKQLTWAEIDLSAYAHNIKELRRATQPPARLMAVGKANGYGHGAIEVARTALQNAGSIAGLLLTTECLITEIPEKEPPMPAGGGHDHGMM